MRYSYSGKFLSELTKIHMKLRTVTSIHSQKPSFFFFVALKAELKPNYDYLLLKTHSLNQAAESLNTPCGFNWLSL